MSFTIERLKIALRDDILPGFLFRWRAHVHKVPDARLYRPTFQPWLGLSEFRAIYGAVSKQTLLDAERLWILYSLARQCLVSDADFLEAGVYRGGTARLLQLVIKSQNDKRHLHLFDTFGGMPLTDRLRDLHTKEDFSDTSLESVSAFVGREAQIVYHRGFIPDTFAGLETLRFAFSHIDVDIYRSVLDCCHFIYPRTLPGGIMLFDDYGLPSCPGARQAIDEFFAAEAESPLVLRTGQAIVCRACGIAG
jgi:O-methyltransferase